MKPCTSCDSTLIWGYNMPLQAVMDVRQQRPPIVIYEKETVCTAKNYCTTTGTSLLDIYYTNKGNSKRGIILQSRHISDIAEVRKSPWTLSRPVVLVNLQPSKCTVWWRLLNITTTLLPYKSWVFQERWPDSLAVGMAQSDVGYLCTVAFVLSSPLWRPRVPIWPLP